jgi:hypothetical protein
MDASALWCNESVLKDHDGRAGYGLCGRALKPGNTSGKCEDHTPRVEARVEGSHAGAAHLSLDRPVRVSYDKLSGRTPAPFPDPAREQRLAYEAAAVGLAMAEDAHEIAKAAWDKARDALDAAKAACNGALKRYQDEIEIHAASLVSRG